MTLEARGEFMLILALMGDWGRVASRSHRAQWGFCVSPSNDLGSLERLRRDGLVGTIGW